MNWAWTVNEHDEIPMDDINDVVVHMEEYVRAHGVRLHLPLRRIRNQIVEYLSWRMRHAWIDISPPRHAQYYPKSWTTHAERVWSDWLTDEFRPEDWIREVIAPVFGSNERFWEAQCTTRWRLEVFAFLPFWIQRDWNIVAEFDPSHQDEIMSESEEIIERD